MDLHARAELQADGYLPDPDVGAAEVGLHPRTHVRLNPIRERGGLGQVGLSGTGVSPRSARQGRREMRQAVDLDPSAGDLRGLHRQVVLAGPGWCR